MTSNATQMKLFSIENKKAKKSFFKIEKSGYKTESFGENLTGIYFNFIDFKLMNVLRELDFNHISQFFLTKNKLYFLINYLKKQEIGFNIFWSDKLDFEAQEEYKQLRFNILQGTDTDKVLVEIKKFLEFIGRLEGEEGINFEAISFQIKGGKIKITQSGIVYCHINQIFFLNALIKEMGNS